jgi:putative aldouronate transport system substrate-binding protein
MIRNVRISAILVLFLFGAGAVFGSGQGDDSSAGEVKLTPPGTLPIVEETVTISGFVAQSAWISDMVDNEATIELEKRTNIKLDLMVVLDEAAAEKKSLLLASGDYPGVFFSGNFNNEDILLFGMDQGIFQPMNDQIERMGVNVKKIFAYYPELRANITAPDGNIYGLPGINECFHCTYSQKMWINTQWLDNLGLAVPETTDDFYQVLKAIKASDANGNGDPNDEIPLMGSIKSWHNPVYDFIMNAWVYNNGADYFASDNGVLSFAPAQPEWQEGLRYLRKLYDEELIYPASFTQTREQAQTIGDNPDAALFFAGTAGHLGMYMRIESDPPYDRHKEWAALAPLTGPDGVKVSAIYRDFSGAKYVITDKAKYPDVAFRLGDYIYGDEGTTLMEAGPEGFIWEPAKPGDKGLTGEPARFRNLETAKGHGDVDNYSWGQQAPTVRTAVWRASWAADQNLMTSQGYELRLFKNTAEKYEPYAPKEWYTRVFMDPKDVEEVAQMKTNIIDYMHQATVQFIVGELDIESDWGAYIAQLKKLELDQYMAFHQTAWTAKLRNQ